MNKIKQLIKNPIKKTIVWLSYAKKTTIEKCIPWLIVKVKNFKKSKFGLYIEEKFFNIEEASHNHEAPQKKINVIRLFALIFALLFIWAAFSKIEQSTTALGQVMPSSRSQIIQSFDGGVLEQLLVKEGDKVVKDQVLAKLDKTRMESGYLETRAKAAALSGTVARLKNEVYGTPLKFEGILDDYPEFVNNQKTLLSKRKKSINDELSALESQKELTKQELSMTEPLLKTGDVSKVEVIRLKKQVNDISAQIANKKNKYFQDAQAELSKAEEDYASILQTLTQKREQLDRIELKSPMAGTVKNVKITTLGGVIKSGEEVMQIVPDGDALMVEVKVKPADIAFIKPGLFAIVKIDAYDYSIYGTLKGKVSFISPDTLTEENKSAEQTYYRVQIQTDGKGFSSSKKNLEIQPGMTAKAEIITGENTVLNYLIKPITKTLKESLTER